MYVYVYTYLIIAGQEVVDQRTLIQAVVQADVQAASTQVKQGSAA